jgi:hypothetical protein
MQTQEAKMIEEIKKRLYQLRETINRRFEQLI